MRKFIKDILNYIPSQIIPAIVGILLLPLITKNFPPEDYGKYIIVISAINVILIIFGWIPTAILRFYPKYEKEKKEEFFTSSIILFSFFLFLSFLIFFLIIVLSFRFYSYTYRILFIHGFILFFFQGIFDVFLHFLRIRREVVLYSSLQSGFSLLNILIAFILTRLYKNIVVFLISSIISLFLLDIVLIFKLMKGKRFFFKKFINFNYKELFIYAFPIVIGNLFYWILRLSDRYIIKLFHGDVPVGIYSASFNISEKTLLIFVTLFKFASGPIAIKIFEKFGEDETKKFISNFTSLYIITTLPIVVLLSSLSLSILELFTSPNYFSGYKIFTFITLGIFIMGLNQCFQTVLTLYYKTKQIMVSSIIAGIFNILFNFIFVPKYSFYASSISYFLSQFLFLILVIYFSRKYMIWKFPFSVLLKSIFCCILLYSVIYFTRMFNMNRLIVEILLKSFLSLTVYFVFLFITKGIDIKRLKDYLGNNYEI